LITETTDSRGKLATCSPARLSPLVCRGLYESFDRPHPRADKLRSRVGQRDRVWRQHCSKRRRPSPPCACPGATVLHIRRERRYQDALAELRRLAAFVYGVEVSVEVRDGTVIDATTKAALDYGANLIVVGTYRHSALKHYITGNIVDRLLQVAPCPVLAVGHGRHIGDSSRADRLVA
jgi:nucleotide-binding universal stress UspA family protein